MKQNEKNAIVTLNMRTTNKIKEMLNELAEEDHRTATGQVEWLIMKEWERRKINISS